MSLSGTVTGQKILSYACAVYDYAATATSNISLKAGDRIAVLSKTGADKGWWKGEHLSTGRVSGPFIFLAWGPIQKAHQGKLR